MQNDDYYSRRSYYFLSKPLMMKYIYFLSLYVQTGLLNKIRTLNYRGCTMNKHIFFSKIFSFRAVLLYQYSVVSSWSYHTHLVSFILLFSFQTISFIIMMNDKTTVLMCSIFLHTVGTLFLKGLM